MLPARTLFSKKHLEGISSPIKNTQNSVCLSQSWRSHGPLALRGGVHPDYFVKLDFEIAVDQQTRARDRTFEGVPDSG